MNVELTIPETAILMTMLIEKIERNKELAKFNLEHGYDGVEWIEKDTKRLETILNKLKI